MACIEFRDVVKKYGDQTVLNGINMVLEEAKLITLLGPSGCGKSTLLRCLAGLEETTSGQIFIDGVDVTHVPPQQRGIGMVFQQYSLFPNMNVFDNIAFPLKLAKEKPERIKERVHEVLSIVDLVGRKKAYPHELSGGQQQRVALARSIIYEPKVLLLDEPLSAIDAKLRKALQDSIRRIQKELRITTVFVTHDQDEAMIMSDEIYLMNKGIVEQKGRPVEIYTNPQTKFSAEFIGNYNILTKEEITAVLKDFQVDADYVAIRPETIQLTKDKSVQSDYCIAAKISSHLLHGNVLRYHIDINGIKLYVDALFRSFQLFEDQEQVYMNVDKHNILAIKENTAEALG